MFRIKMRCRYFSLVFLGIFAFLPVRGHAGEPDEADWGYPSPFTFYQRGPGYVRMMIFDSLTWKDDKNIIPWLAKSWSYDEAARTYTLDLREDVWWQDGKPFTASDVVFTYRYFKKHPHPYFNVQAIEKVEALGACWKT